MQIQSNQRWMIIGICLLMVSGCRTFTAQSIDDPDRRFSLKDSPAQKRQPRSLEDLAGSGRQPPASPPSFAPVQDASQFDPRGPLNQAPQPSAGIGLNDVSLQRTDIHVDPLDIEDIAKDADEQLPGIIESAVHPYSKISSPATSTRPNAIPDSIANNDPGTVTGQQPPMHSIQTVGYQDEAQATVQPAAQQSAPRTAPPAAFSTNEVAQPSLKLPPSNPAITSLTTNTVQTDQKPVASEVNQAPLATTASTSPQQQHVQPPTQRQAQLEPPAVAPIRQQEFAQQQAATQQAATQQAEPNQQQAQVRVNTNPQPMMKIVAEPGSARGTDKPVSTTDHLFADLNQPAPEPKGEVMIVVQDQNPEQPPVTSIPSVAPTQTTSAVQPVNHQEASGTVISLSDSSSEPNARQDLPEQATTPSKVVPLNWQQQLGRSVQQLDGQLRQSGQNAKADQQIRLMLMRLAAGESLPVPIRINSDDEQYRKYWYHQLNALNLLLNERSKDSIATSSRRQTTLAAEQLEHAHGQLSGMSTMRLSQTAFATEVRGFGQYTPVSASFQPAQQVLIYCEIENYSLRQADVSGQIQQVAELQGQYSIVDATNRVVYQHQYQTVKDMSQRRRKDFYMFFPVTIPQMAPGQYRLQLSVEDLVGKKIAISREDLVFNVSPNRTAARPRPTNPPVALRDDTMQQERRSQPPAAAQTAAPRQQVQSAIPENRRAHAAPNNMPLPINRLPGQQVQAGQQTQPPSNGSVRQASATENMPLPINGNQPIPSNGSSSPQNRQR